MCSVLCGPNQPAGSNKPSVVAVLCSCSRKTTVSLRFAGTGKGQAEFLLAHLACKCNFPSCSSLKLFPRDLHSCFFPAPQVSLDNFLYSFFHGWHLKQCFQSRAPLTVLSLQAYCFSLSSPGGRSGASPCGWVKRHLLLLYVSFLLQSCVKHSDQGGQKRRKTLSALASDGGACDDETLLVILPVS